MNDFEKICAQLGIPPHQAPTDTVLQFALEQYGALVRTGLATEQIQCVATLAVGISLGMLSFPDPSS